jgi:predicted Zn-dependent peptidase
MKHNVSEVKLKNGAKGLLVNVPGATVMTFEFNFRAGEYLVEHNKWETPHLMEHIVLGANQLVPKARDFQAEFEKNGAYSNASTGSYDISYEAECADFEWDRILSLLLTAVTKPLFLEEEFRAEFGNVREELNARGNNHFRHLSLALREAYGFQAQTDQNRLKLMDNVTVQDVRDHYARTHTSQNLRFVIAGNITPERKKLIRGLLGSIELPEGDERFELPEEKPKLLQSPLYIPNDTVENIYFYMDTFVLRRLTDPESDALDLLNSMLTETLYSRIWGTAREKGLVYSMSSGLSHTNNASNWWFGAQVMPRNAQPLFDIMKRELEKVFDGTLGEEDVQAAKQYAIGRYQRGAQTVAGVAGGYAQRYFFDEIIEDYYQVPARIKAVTRPRIIKAANTMFEDKVWGIGCLSSAGEEFVHDLHKHLRSLW